MSLFLLWKSFVIFLTSDLITTFVLVSSSVDDLVAGVRSDKKLLTADEVYNIISSSVDDLVAGVRSDKKLLTADQVSNIPLGIKGSIMVS